MASLSSMLYYSMMSSVLWFCHVKSILLCPPCQRVKVSFYVLRVKGSKCVCATWRCTFFQWSATTAGLKSVLSNSPWTQTTFAPQRAAATAAPIPELNVQENRETEINRNNTTSTTIPTTTTTPIPSPPPPLYHHYHSYQHPYCSYHHHHHFHIQWRTQIWCPDLGVFPRNFWKSPAKNMHLVNSGAEFPITDLR